MSTIKARVRYPFEHNPYSFLSINSTSVLSGMWLKAKLKSKRICWALVLMPFLARFENKNDRNLGIFLPLQNFSYFAVTKSAKSPDFPSSRKECLN